MVKNTIPTNPNLLDEQLVPIQKCGSVFPYPVGRKAVERYIRTGVRGIRLSTVLIGHRRFTSVEEIGRWLRETNRQTDACQGQRQMTEQEMRLAKTEVGLRIDSN